MLEPEKKISIDNRRTVVIPGDKEKTLNFCAEHLALLSRQSIEDHGAFYIALSGGSTPKALFQRICNEPLSNQIEWDKWHIFWSDERTVGPNHSDSNYRMAMESGLKNMPIPSSQIHRIEGELDPHEAATKYEQAIQSTLEEHPFDLIMLGMGEDGHTASLFPGTEGLSETNKLFIANFVPQKETWRLTFTYPLINQAKNIAIYVIGASKQEMLHKIVSEKPHTFPVEKVGDKNHPATWMADRDAASLL